MATLGVVVHVVSVEIELEDGDIAAMDMDDVVEMAGDVLYIGG